MRTLTIPARFNGPPRSGHGGYSSAVVAALLGEPAVVELRSPPPLDTPMEVVEVGDGLEVRHAGTLVARARPAPPPDLVPPAPVSVREAQAASLRYRGLVDHPFPTCFVCGPERAPGDGMRIFPGPTDGEVLMAAPWTPDASLDRGDGAVEERFVWAALDCPSGWGSFGDRTCVLASLRIRRDAPLPVGEELIALGWCRGSDGRKVFGASAVVDGAGRVLAVADALWIELRGPG